MASAKSEESREGVPLTHLDEPLFDDSDATKRDLVDYVEQMADRMVAHLRNRPLSVIRVRAGQAPFMQKNLPKYTPDWVQSVSIWAERPKRDIAYALANDRRTLIWLANQRAVEYHPGLMTTDDPLHQTHLILDLDPPSDVDRQEGFRLAVAATRLVKQVLDEAGLAGAAKTSGAKGMHVFVPLAPTDTVDVAATTRAIAARAEKIDPQAGHHRLRGRGTARQGLRGLDPGRRRDGHHGVQPTDPTWGPGVVPGRLGRPRGGQPDGTSRSRRRPACWATATRGRT